jgi:glycine hydroxymethyltransferase
MNYQTLKTNDSKVFNAIQAEVKRQKEGIELIASENYVSEAVLEAMGSILTNKYSEGYAGKRYYGGNRHVDEIENLAIERAKKLFGAEHVNVQPYSGSPANLAVHPAFLQPGDKTMGMSLAAGGHLTHGFKVSISGRYFDSVSYGVDSKGYIDYDEVRKMANEHRPKLLWAGYSAYSRIIDWKQFRKIADEVGAILAVDMAHFAGLVAGGVMESPVPFADVVTTTTHKTLRGPRGAMIMCKQQFAEAIDKAVFPGIQGGPHNHTTAGIAVALAEASTPEFKEYAKQIVANAKKMSEELMKKGYEVVSGGTDNHLMLVDVTKVGSDVTGGVASDVLESVNITVNKNAIPNDPRKPWDPSGIRIGTPAITTRGMKEADMVKIVEFIDRAIKARGDNAALKRLLMGVIEFSNQFELPGIS